MVYEIYTFGNGEILKGVFDAMAMCLNAHTGSLFEPLKRLGLIIGTFWALLYAIYGDQMKAFTAWIIPMTLFMNLLFVPSTSLWIHDPVTKFHQKVDHVPYGLAAFAGYVSKIGYHITEEVEKIFSLPDDLKYQKSGSLFASNIIQQAKTFHITNEDLAENMRQFVGQCVVFDAMLGRKYTIQDLRQSDDIWALVSTNASPVRSFIWKDPGGSGIPSGSPQIITCKEGVSRFNRLWGTELDQAATLYGKKLFGKHSLINPKTELLKYLPMAYTTLGDMAKSASDILKQQMMIYAIVDGIEQKSTALGNSPNFAARRAYLQQRATYETLGAMAGETLPTMKAVLEAIAYAAFLFVIPLTLLPFGWRILGSWAQILLWLQMWAPLYVILNYIMTMAARSKTLAALSLSNEAGVTLASSVGIANVNADIAAMAGYLAMSIPFLCIALVKGVGSFVHMASHLGNVSQSTASMAAGEVTSGNFSYGNISEGSTQIANTTMLQHSMAATYRSASFQESNGRMDMITSADGSQIVNMGMSSLPINLNVADSQSAQFSQMASQSYQKAMNLSESSAHNLSSSYRDLVDLSHSIGQNQSLSDSVSQGQHIEQATVIHKSAQMIEDFAKQNNISVQKAADIIGEISAGIGIGKNAASLSAKGSLNAFDQQAYQSAEKMAESEDFQNTMREANQASKNLSHNLNDEYSKRLAESTTGSFERGESERQEAAKSYKQAEDFQKQASYSKNHAATINANYTQEFTEWLSNQPMDNAGGGRMGVREAARIAASPEKAAIYAEYFMKEKQLNPSPTEYSSAAGSINPKTIKESYHQDTDHQSYPATKQSLEEVKDRGRQTIHSNIEEQGKFLRQDTVQSMQIKQATIHEQGQKLIQKGEQTKQSVQGEQGKSIIKRLGGKGISEVKEIIPGVPNFNKDEPQQK